VFLYCSPSFQISDVVAAGLLCTILLLTLRICHVAALDLTNSNWITFGPRDVDWSGAVIHDFRLHLTTPAGKTAVSAHIIMACDDYCLAWANGFYIGDQSSWKTSNSFCVSLSASSNVFVVSVQNLGISVPNASAFIAAIQINYSDGSSDISVTDTQWRANDRTRGSSQADYDDSTWLYANIVGAANDPPWNLPAAPESFFRFTRRRKVDMDGRGFPEQTKQEYACRLSCLSCDFHNSWWFTDFIWCYCYYRR
jgi:hypothetical protein